MVSLIPSSSNNQPKVDEIMELNTDRNAQGIEIPPNSEFEPIISSLHHDTAPRRHIGHMVGQKTQKLFSNIPEIITGTTDGVYSIGAGTLSCAAATASTLASAYTQGIRGTTAAVAKSCLGIGDYKKAYGALFQRPDIAIPGKRMLVDDRSYANRVGESLGNVFSGLSKTAASTFVGTAYVTGTALNISTTLQEKIFGTDPTTTPSLTNFSGASCHFASGVNQMGSYLVSVGASAIPVIANAAKNIATPFLTNPVDSTRTTLFYGAVIGGLYGASSFIIRAKHSASTFEAISNIAGAALVTIAAGCAATALNTNPAY